MGFFRTSNQKEIDVWSQDQTTPPFQYYLIREDKTDITLTSDISKGDTTSLEFDFHYQRDTLGSRQEYIK